MFYLDYPSHYESLPIMDNSNIQIPVMKLQIYAFYL